MSKMRSERKRTSVSMVANYEDNSSPKERNSYYQRNNTENNQQLMTVKKRRRRILAGSESKVGRYQNSIFKTENQFNYDYLNPISSLKNNTSTKSTLKTELSKPKKKMSEKINTQTYQLDYLKFKLQNIDIDLGKSKLPVRRQIKPTIYQSQLIFQPKLNKTQSNVQTQQNSRIKKIFNSKLSLNLQNDSSDEESQKYNFPSGRISGKRQAKNNLIDPNIKTYERSNTAQEIVKGMLNNAGCIKQFVLKDTPASIRYCFEIHVVKHWFQTEFLFWICFENGVMNLLLRAVNPGTNLTQTIVGIEIANSLGKGSTFLTLVSPLLKNQYTLFHASTQEYAKNIKCKILATVNKNIVDNRAILSLCKPKSKKQQIRRNSFSNSLYQLTAKHNLKKQINIYKSSNLQEKQIKTINESLGLSSWKKINILEDKAGSMRILIGKKGSKKYKLMIGEGISPVQGFILGITHISF